MGVHGPLGTPSGPGPYFSNLNSSKTPFINSLAGLPRLTTGFHFHNASNTGSRSWCSGAYPALLSYLHSLLVQHCGLLCSHGDLVVPFARFVTMQSSSFQDR